MNRHVLLTIEDQTFDATVHVEGQNGRSLVLLFDGDAPLKGPARARGAFWTAVGLLLVLYKGGSWYEIFTVSKVLITPLNPFAYISEIIGRFYPEAALTVSAPTIDDGVWSLEIDHVNVSVWVEWTQFTGYGVSRLRAASYGESCDEFFRSSRLAVQRVVELLHGPVLDKPAVHEPGELGGEA